MNTSNRFHRSHPSRADTRRCPVQSTRRSELATLTVPPRRLSLKHGARRACRSVVPRLGPIGPFGATTESTRPPLVPIDESNIRAKATGGLAAWQQIVLAAYIEKHIAEPVTVHALARFVYLSSSCFRRAFKRSFGIPPHRYVVQQRIERAKAPLLVSRWSIAEIARSLSFTQTSSFPTAFLKITGNTPIEYRMNQR